MTPINDARKMGVIVANRHSGQKAEDDDVHLNYGASKTGRFCAMQVQFLRGCSVFRGSGGKDECHRLLRQACRVSKTMTPIGVLKSTDINGMNINEYSKTRTEVVDD